ncbi:hypothetical protein L0F63_006147 [Massospora cicadina]|nr:hypothetical protein L0F63_006147 [Massospora cicadina]
MPQPKKQAANSKASAKPRKATIPRTNFITTNEVDQAKSVADSDYEVPLVPEGGVPTLAPIFNATPHKLEHIFLRPDTYISPTKMNTLWQWIYDDTTDSLIEKDIQFVSDFFKIFDEVLVNTSDNKVRIPKLEDANKAGTYCQGYPKNQECETIQFFTMKEYQQWSINPENNAIKIYYFKTMQVDECQIINLAFSKQEADAHKGWLHQYHPGTYIARVVILSPILIF